MSNAPYYSRTRQVTTVSEAIQTVGFDTVKSIAVTASVHSYFSDIASEVIIRDLWHHSLCTAIASRKFSIQFGDREPELSFIVGLLHDIGKLVLFKVSPDLFLQIFNIVDKKNEPFSKVEYDILGFDHCDIASMLLSRWAYPTELVNRVARHHTPYNSARPGKLAPYMITAIANNVSRPLGAGFHGQYDERLQDLFVGESGFLPAERIESLMKELETEYQNQLSIFEN